MVMFTSARLTLESKHLVAFGQNSPLSLTFNLCPTDLSVYVLRTLP